MPQDGCRVNTVRGGGCYFGPDVTGKILEKYNLQFLIRSHECKQEGYEFCHNRKVGEGDGVKDTWVSILPGWGFWGGLSQLCIPFSGALLSTCKILERPYWELLKCAPS